MDLMTREIFMPLMCGESQSQNEQPDKLMDTMHRVMSSIAISQSHIEVN
jgi:hypothetical protein